MICTASNIYGGVRSKNQNSMHPFVNFFNLDVITDMQNKTIMSLNENSVTAIFLRKFDA